MMMKHSFPMRNDVFFLHVFSPSSLLMAGFNKWSLILYFNIYFISLIMIIDGICFPFLGKLQLKGFLVTNSRVGKYQLTANVLAAMSS